MRRLVKNCLVAGGVLIGLSSADMLQAQEKAAPGQQAQGTTGGNAQSGNVAGIPQSAWFSNPTIRQQLQLNNDQFNRLNNAYMQSFNRYNQGIAGLDKNLTESQRAQRLQEMNQAFSNDFSKSVDGVLDNEAARRRFNQYGWQYQGYGAFSDPNIQKELNLTDEQTQKFNQYNNEWNNQLGIWRREYSNNRDEVSKSLIEARREAQDRINSTLSPEQRKIWSDKIGKPIDWPADVYFPHPAKASSEGNPRSRE